LQNDWNENRARLIGTVMGEPEYSHSNHNEDFFRFPLRTDRLSGTSDQPNVLLSRTLLELRPLHRGDRVAIEGEIRSYNNRSGTGARLVITLLAKEILPAQQTPDDNRVTLAGVLCRCPTYRRTPLGREICDLLLAVNRRYGRSDYLPCIAWGTLARDCADLPVGFPMRLHGRLQSRGYTKLTEEGPVRRTAFEISVMTMEPAEP
jgi:single-stranded DNA-binding protein